MKRERLLDFLGGHCIICGENDKRILTMNHILGGGVQAFLSATSINAYYRDVLAGIIPKNELDVRCMNDNILYEYETGRRTWLQ